MKFRQTVVLEMVWLCDGMSGTHTFVLLPGHSQCGLNFSQHLHQGCGRRMAHVLVKSGHIVDSPAHMKTHVTLDILPGCEETCGLSDWQHVSLIIFKFKTQLALIHIGRKTIELSQCWCLPCSWVPWMLNCRMSTSSVLHAVHHRGKGAVGVVVLLPRIDQKLQCFWTPALVKDSIAGILVKSSHHQVPLHEGDEGMPCGQQSQPWP